MEVNPESKKDTSIMLIFFKEKFSREIRKIFPKKNTAYLF